MSITQPNLYYQSFANPLLHAQSFFPVAAEQDYNLLINQAGQIGINSFFTQGSIPLFVQQPGMDFFDYSFGSQFPGIVNSYALDWGTIFGQNSMIT